MNKTSLLKSKLNSKDKINDLGKGKNCLDIEINN